MALLSGIVKDRKTMRMTMMTTTMMMRMRMTKWMKTESLVMSRKEDRVDMGREMYAFNKTDW